MWRISAGESPCSPNMPRSFTYTINIIRNAAFPLPAIVRGGLGTVRRAEHLRAGSTLWQTETMTEAGRITDDCGHSATKEPHQRLWLGQVPRRPISLHPRQRRMLYIPPSRGHPALNFSPAAFSL